MLELENLKEVVGRVKIQTTKLCLPKREALLAKFQSIGAQILETDILVKNESICQNLLGKKAIMMSIASF